MHGFERHRFFARAFMFAIAVPLFFGAESASAGPAFAASSLGGVNLQHACDAQYPGQDRSAIVLDGRSAFSWTCELGASREGINVDQECATEYGYGATAMVGEQSNPYSWSCTWRVTGQMRSAVAWATQEMHSAYPFWSDHFERPWSGICEAFAEEAEGFPYAFGSAHDAYLWQLQHGRVHTDAAAPPGAEVYYGGAGGLGHVAISIGGGELIGALGYDGERFPISEYAINSIPNPYLGWSMPIGS